MISPFPVPQFLHLNLTTGNVIILTDAHSISFGWVNASYVYGLQIVNAHMRRALGTLTPYETFVKALEDTRNKALAEMI